MTTPSYKLSLPSVSAEYPFESHFTSVNGQQVHHVEQGEGDPVLFIHGNPTSSYLWRNVLPFVSDKNRGIALDLIGMGQSGNPDIAYTFADHLDYLEGFITELQLENITLVVHDWGAALGFEYARRHPDKVQGIVFMEGLLPPSFPKPSFESMGKELGSMFKAFKDPVQGNELVINQNVFIEKTLPAYVNRTLDEQNMTAYRAPYIDKEDRTALLVWPCEVPIAGSPTSNVELMQGIEQFMQTTDMDMLLLYADPGALIPMDMVPWYQEYIKNLETVYIGQGLHFIQEDQPTAIGLAIQEWLRRH